MLFEAGQAITRTCQRNNIRTHYAKHTLSQHAFSRAMPSLHTLHVSHKWNDHIFVWAEPVTWEKNFLSLIFYYFFFLYSFNSYGGVSGALRTCMARLYILEQEYKQKMKNEIISVLSSQELSQEALKEMRHLHNFILEILRMHPPVPVFFGRAK